MIKIDKKSITAKKEKLDACKAYLKSEFIGIDSIIDDLLDYIQVWYLMPEILSRPVIVNLWGMTGVGKTDLVRKMVKFLDYQDRFTEIELSNVDTTSWTNSVSEILSNNEIADEKPAIVLFDEIQRFNTMDDEGKPVPQTKFTDFWELLSDGRLSKKTKDDIDYYLYTYMRRKRENELKKSKGEKVDNHPAIDIWDAKTLRTSLGHDAELFEFAEMNEEDMINLIKKTKNKKKIYEPINHSKTLILISGNLDKAFQMASQTGESDIDADIFHAFTKKITVIDVKNALTKKFRPEQVSRFGNIHLIYKSLRKVDFEALIQKEIDRIIHETKEKIGISLAIDNSINQLIYRNGVFPVQGVRPVFSSIVDVLDTHLSKFVFKALIDNNDHISIKYDKESKKIVAHINKEKIEISYIGRIDKIRQSNVADVISNVSVHECGHAVVYIALMGMAPLQLKSKLANSYASGFTFPHQIHETKENIINKIKIYLAGGIAEEIIFGKQHASIGRCEDREQATILAIEYIRKYGFDDEFQAVYTLEDYPNRIDKRVTDIDIEKMIARLVNETQELLNKHLPLVKKLSRELSIKGSLEANEVAKISQMYNLKALVKEEGYLHIFNYDKKLHSSEE